MGVYIKGMSMPKEAEKIIILTSSGYVEDVSGQVIQGVEAVEFPPHGLAPVRRGKWVYKHRHRGGFRIVTGEDEYGNQHTIKIDERYATDDPYCSECGKLNEAYSLNYCPCCGAKMEVQDGG